MRKDPLPEWMGRTLHPHKPDVCGMLRCAAARPCRRAEHAPCGLRDRTLQNASSIAGLLLSTEAVVTEKPEPNGGAPAMPGGGGGMATCTEPIGRTAERGV